MQINESIKKEILDAIKKNGEGSFETTVSGGLKHFVSSDSSVKGMYIETIQLDGKEYKIYMI